MNKKKLFSVAIKFTALLLLLNFVQNVFFLILEMSSQSIRDVSIYAVSQNSNVLRHLSIFLYGFGSYYLFFNSDFLSGKIIKESDSVVVTRLVLIQLVIAFQGFSGILYSSINLATSLMSSFSIMSIGAYDYLPQSGLLNLIIQFVILIISILLLLNYEKLARSLIELIPEKFWGK